MSNLLDKASIILTPTAYNNGEALCVKPSDGSGDFDFSRNSAATRVNAQGLVENVQILSSNLVQNPSFSEEGSEEITGGDFSNPSDWSLAGGIPPTITNNKLNLIGDTYNSIASNIGASLVSGKTYKVSFEITDYTSGGATFRLGGVFGVSKSGLGVHTQYIVSGGASIKLYSSENGTDLSLTNVSVKEVGQNWDFGTGFSIGDGEAVAVSGTSSKLTQSISGLSGKKCSVTFTLSNYGGSGDIKLDFGSLVGQDRNANGTYTEVGTYDIDRLEFFKNAAFEGSISNISVIEITDDTNLPRINYEGFSYDGSGNIVPDSGCGSWLWEPQSTNLIPYSEDFSQSNWIKHAAVVLTSGQLSPDGGNNAYKVQGTIGSSFLLDGGFSAITQQSRSIYMRADTNGVIYTLGDSQSNQINVTTEWQRFELQEVSNSFYAVDFRGSGVTLDTVYIWGAQLEEQSYSTSYIPTEGSTVTRNQDVCTNGGSLASINSTEGVLYAEIAALANDGTTKFLGLNDGSNSNRVVIVYYNVSNRIRAIVSSGGTKYVDVNYQLTNILDFHKVAIKYKLNDFAFWIDGVEVATDTSLNAPIGLDRLDFLLSGANNFFGKTKALAVWKEALSDSELQSLTTI